MSNGVRPRWGWRLVGAWVGLLATATGVSAQAVDIDLFRSQVFSLLNQQRVVNGLPALQRVAPLDTAAQSYSETMRSATHGGSVYLSHTSPDGTSFSTRITWTGYRWTAIGENIAAGQRTPQAVVSAWMNSAGHRANILNRAFRHVGIGVAVGPGIWPNGYQDPAVIWWTTDFGSGTVPTSP